MSLIERAINKRKGVTETASRSSETAKRTETHAVRADDREGFGILEPLAPGIATLQAGDDAMRLAWDLRGNSVLVSQLRNVRREIATLLDWGPARRRSTIVVVTSALPGEGKSFFSVGLARVLAAEQDRKVILVDADLPKRTLTEAMGAGARPGLVDCLADGRQPAEVLCHSDHTALSFMPAGQWRSDAPNLMCGARMDAIFESFRQCDGRHVFVIDTAPVLALGETVYLAEQADLAVLVIRADRTPRAAAEEAMRKLAAERPLAAVLNGQQSSVLEDYYGYRDYYGDYMPRDEG